ncbi:unnamed protein product, partial [Mesorhabditis belari]|uniref:RING-CH-type domain-containing protein n=1 Tax=Mesorhabditis belari TaxID=2138241 RepID=A0AAF3J4C4_9BILA
MNAGKLQLNCDSFDRNYELQLIGIALLSDKTDYQSSHYKSTNTLRRNRLVVRKLRLKPIPASWDPKWTPSRTPLFDPRRYVINQEIRFKKIRDWYEKHQEEYPDLKTVDGKKRLGKDTGEEGGSLIFHGTANLHEKLTKAFLILARAFNSGEIPTNNLIMISLKFFDDLEYRDSRIKISTNSREELPQILREIHKILLNANSPDFFIRYKTDVACCLNRYYKGNRLVVRKLRLKPIPASWDPKWTPSRTPLFDPRRCVIDERIRFKKIMDWYEKHQEEYPDLKTVEGQKRLGKDTGEEGGSLILRFFHGKKKRHEELTKVFLILARAFNSGEIPTNKLIVISLKVFDDSDDEDSRIKISTNSREDLPQILREIHKILLNANSPDFFLRYKTDVACCLNQYFTDFFKIECPQSHRSQLPPSPAGRICAQNEDVNPKLIRPCNCKESVAYIHNRCLLQWVTTTTKKQKYDADLRKSLLWSSEMVFSIFQISSALLLEASQSGINCG